MKWRVVDLFFAEVWNLNCSGWLLLALLDFFFVALVALWSWIDILRYLLTFKALSCMWEGFVRTKSFSPILLSTYSGVKLLAFCYSATWLSVWISFWTYFTFSSCSMNSSTSSLSEEEDEEEDGGRKTFLSSAFSFWVSGAMRTWEFSDKSMLIARWFLY